MVGLLDVEQLLLLVLLVRDYIFHILLKDHQIELLLRILHLLALFYHFFKLTPVFSAALHHRRQCFRNECPWKFARIYYLIVFCEVHLGGQSLIYIVDNVFEVGELVNDSVKLVQLPLKIMFLILFLAQIPLLLVVHFETRTNLLLNHFLQSFFVLSHFETGYGLVG